jgi:hypothetical protein
MSTVCDVAAKQVARSISLSSLQNQSLQYHTQSTIVSRPSSAVVMMCRDDDYSGNRGSILDDQVIARDNCTTPFSEALCANMCWNLHDVKEANHKLIVHNLSANAFGGNFDPHIVSSIASSPMTTTSSKVSSSTSSSVTVSPATILPATNLENQKVAPETAIEPAHEEDDDDAFDALNFLRQICDSELENQTSFSMENDENKQVEERNSMQIMQSAPQSTSCSSINHIPPRFFPIIYAHHFPNRCCRNTALLPYIPSYSLPMAGGTNNSTAVGDRGNEELLEYLSYFFPIKDTRDV